MMTKYLYIASLITAAVLMSSCQDYEDELPMDAQDMSYINLYVATGNNSPTTVTRAMNTAENGENTIHTIKVWAFGTVSTSGGTENRICYGYVEANFDHDPTGADNPDNLNKFYKELKLAIPTVYVENGTADFYFLANAASISTTAAAYGKNTSEETLKALTLGDNYYASFAGNTIPKENSNGLPIARIVEKVPIKTLSTDKTPLYVVMQRAVARVRFYVARDAGADAGFAINSINIGNGETSLSLTNEQVFPKVATWTQNLATASSSSVSAALDAWKATDGNEIEFVGNSANYSTDNISCTLPSSPTAIAAVEDLENTYNNATDKEEWIKGHATLFNVTYLRETDKTALPVSFSYKKVADSEESFTVEETLNLAEGDLLRNHDVIVFAYLKGGGEIVLTVTVMPWELKESTIEYSQTPTISGDPKWKENTYDETMSYPSVAAEEGGIRTITLRAGTAAEYSFEITSPQGFSWIANFTSLTGNPQAFKFVHADNSLSDTFTGTIGTGPTTLKIKAATDTPSESSSAILTLTVRQGEGKNIPLSTLSIYKIVQVAN